MNSPETELAAALRERLSIIRDEASRRDVANHIGKLRAASEKIAALQEQLPRSIDPQLAHFLARCSYDKALALLEARDARSAA